MNNSLFWWPKLPGLDLGLVRIGGPGLGNLLFPWARAIHQCGLHGGRLCFPVWPQLKLGPIVRREQDKRFYGGLFSPVPEDVTGFQRVMALTAFPKFSDYSNSDAKGVVVVQGLADEFRSIYRNQQFVVNEIMKRAIGPALREWHAPKKPLTIAVHIRLGDFSQPQSNDTVNTVSNTSTPIEWYAEIIQAIQEKYPKTRFELHSDGSADELTRVMRIRNVYRPLVHNSLHGIVSIAKCEALIGSGSTFSRWGCFFGKIPAVYFPGQMRKSIFCGEVFEKEFFANEFSNNIPGAFALG